MKSSKQQIDENPSPRSFQKPMFYPSIPVPPHKKQGRGGIQTLTSHSGVKYYIEALGIKKPLYEPKYVPNN